MRKKEMKMRYTILFLTAIVCAEMQAQPDPSVSMLLNHAGKDSIVITLKFTNNNVSWSCEGMQAAVQYDNLKLSPNLLGSIPIHDLHFASSGWIDYSNAFMLADVMLYAEGPNSGSVSIGSNATFNLCKMNWKPQGTPFSGTVSFAYYGNTGATGSTGYLWTGDPDMRAFGSATGLNNVFYPVELKTFSASEEGNTIVLSWVTETETNNAGFEIERRYTNGKGEVTEWKDVGFVKGKGTTAGRTEYISIDMDDHPAGIYQYRLKQIDMDGTAAYSAEAEVRLEGKSDEFILSQNYPNPFGGSAGAKWTTMNYRVSNGASQRGERVELAVYDNLGRIVEKLVDGAESAGNHSVKFYGGNLPAGVYRYQLRSGATVMTRTMLIVP